MPVASPTAGASAPPAGRPVDVVVAGAAGRMGTRVVACLQGAPDLRLVGALEAPAHPALGRDAAERGRADDHTPEPQSHRVPLSGLLQKKKNIKVNKNRTKQRTSHSNSVTRQI